MPTVPSTARSANQVATAAALTEQIRQVEMARRYRVGQAVSQFTRLTTGDEWLRQVVGLVRTGQVAAANEAIAYMNALVVAHGGNPVALDGALRGVGTGYGNNPVGETFRRVQRQADQILAKDGPEVARRFLERKATRTAADLTWLAARDTLQQAVIEHSGVIGYRRIASPLACGACLALATGRTLPPETAFLDHPHCFPAGTLVSGPPAAGATARMYEGKVVVVRFSGGDELTVTPNHPVLTDGGWVAAGLLDEGSNVIRTVRAQGPSPSVNPDDDDVPALIEDVAESLRGAGRVTSAQVPGSPEDFHGDGSRAEVDVVWTNRFLRDRFDAPLGEEGRQGPLNFDLTCHPLFIQLRSAAAFIKRTLAASYGLMGGGGVQPVLLGRPCGHHETVGFGGSADWYFGIDEPSADRAPTDAEGLSDGILGLAGLIAGRDLVVRQPSTTGGAELDASELPSFGWGSPDTAVPKDPAQPAFADPVPTSADLARFAGDVVSDRVIDTFRRSFSGHVYNLETVAGWYIANGTIVHNCRCSIEPVVRGAPKVNRRNGQRLFDEMTESEQDRQFGPEKAALLRSGDIKLEDLVSTPKGHIGRRKLITETPLRDLEASIAA